MFRLVCLQQDNRNNLKYFEKFVEEDEDLKEAEISKMRLQRELELERELEFERTKNASEGDETI